MKSLEDLVQDWGGFERLIADLHDTGTVTVEHDVVLTGRSGAPRQIDVLVRHKEGLYEHLIVVECKYRNTPVERLHVDALATTVREVGASRGVIFSTKGFQSGTITQAEHDGISLYQIREPTDLEWGLPGRHIDLWMQFIQISIGELAVPGTMVAGPPPADSSLSIELGERVSTTPISGSSLNEPTLESLIDRLARESARVAYRPIPMDFGDGVYEGTHRSRFRVNFAPKEPVRCPRDGAVILIPRIEFDVGLKVDQSRMQIDRGERYVFVLAVEDCVNKVVSTASREADSKTVLEPARSDPPDPEDTFKNGSILQVWLKGFADFAEFADVPRADGPTRSLSLKGEGGAA